MIWLAIFFGLALGAFVEWRLGRIRSGGPRGGDGGSL